MEDAANPLNPTSAIKSISIDSNELIGSWRWLSALQLSRTESSSHRTNLKQFKRILAGSLLIRQKNQFSLTP